MVADDVGQDNDFVFAGGRLAEGVDLVLAVRVADVVYARRAGQAGL